MSLIEQEGTYRGNITDHVVNLSTNDFPQLVLSLEGTELYDVETQSWCDWKDVPENEITAYLVLIDSKNNQTLNYKQVQEALGWDGKSFSGLATLDLSKTRVQFRVEPNTYNGKTTLQVTWIDKYDAIPGKTFRKLDVKELKTLDAKFKNVLGGKATPATAAKAPPKAPSKTSTKAPATTSDLPPGKCTKDEAWEACVDLKDDKKFTDEQLAQTWTKAVDEIAANKTDEQITPEEWFLIKEKVLAETALF